MGLRKMLGIRKPKRFTGFRPVPWITDGALSELETFLDARTAVKALEFGAGASTLWLASRTNLISIEHDSEWHARVAEELSARGLLVDLRLIDRPYFPMLEALQDGAFDLILIDGRDRVECLRRAKRLLATGGLLLIDNTERVGTPDKPGRYFEMLELLKDWQCQEFWQHGPDRTGWSPRKPWCTTIYRHAT
jgi:predicted O-methyltransferase YrrM